MNQQPDKLFRDKLENFQRPVSSDAWNKVQANLDRKKASLLWLKIAAGVSLIVGVGWMLIMQNGSSETIATSAVNESKLKKHAQSPAANSEPVEEKSEKTIPFVEVKPKTIARQSCKNQPKTKTESGVVLDKNVDSLVNNENIQPVAVVENEKSAIEETKVQAEPKVISPEGNTLVLSADEVNQKYLSKKNSEGDATSENKKSSTLQRLLSKVSDLKHNQDPLGELRQKKNEILALNLKSEKQRNQNR
jgi:hypothetical protein